MNLVGRVVRELCLRASFPFWFLNRNAGGREIDRTDKRSLWKNEGSFFCKLFLKPCAPAERSKDVSSELLMLSEEA